MRKLIAAVFAAAALAAVVPASAAPGSTCAAPVDARCNYRRQDGTVLLCDLYWNAPPALPEQCYIAALPPPLG